MPNCLIAWERVCLPRESGGLGVKNLEDLNHCLLMKFVHKLHEPAQLPWKNWFLSHAGSVFSNSSGSYLASLVNDELQRYRSVTSVMIGDGKHTSFWHDCWLTESSLANTFPALFSHCVHDKGTVSAILASGVQPLLRPRLTRAAHNELQMLNDYLAPISLQDTPDSRLLETTKKEFTISGAYRVLHGLAPLTDASRIWSTKVPTKIKFFAWLLYHGRLNTRAHLFHRNIKPLHESWCERCHGVLETDEHLFKGCHVPQEIWACLHFSIQNDSFRRPWQIDLPNTLPETISVDMLLILLWHIWKARNELVFDRHDLSPTEIIRKTLRDIDAWSCRYKRLRPDVFVWREWLQLCIS